MRCFYISENLVVAKRHMCNHKSCDFTVAFTNVLCFFIPLKLLSIDPRVPVSFKMLMVYDFISTVFTDMSMVQEALTLLTNHCSFLFLVQEREPVSPVRGLAVGDPSMPRHFANHPALPNGLRALSWLVAHEVLPVRTAMHSRGMSSSATCPRPGCGAPESVRHLLWECSAAVDLWAMAGSQQFPCLPAGEVPEAQVVPYGVSRRKTTTDKFSHHWLTPAAAKTPLDLHKPAGKKAYADPPSGYVPNGRSDGCLSRRCRRQART
ncbi:uncharacterized protein LOC115576792 [Sparus aurata]|uniref:uncharacterized protein LOC115576792 n=1 Tax=Sparus aurata TaxID=8175 RepID=UPI0011C1A713|nr:uncharacterized protein LOC115576792 [Sparus aurata]